MHDAFFCTHPPFRNLDFFNCSFNILTAHLSVRLLFKELQALQKEKDNVYKEKEDLSARLLEQEETQKGWPPLRHQTV